MINPKPEYRITAVEKRVTKLEAVYEEISDETANELKELRIHVDLGFQQAHDFVQERFSTIEKRLDRVDSDLTEIKGMLQKTQAEQNDLLRQLLERLPKQRE